MKVLPCRYVHGERVIWPPIERHGLHLMQVLDFNAHRVRIDEANAEEHHKDLEKPIDDPSKNWELVLQDTHVLAGIIFKETVLTSLPFRCIARTHNSRYSGFMIDEERIIGLKVGFFFSLSSCGFVALADTCRLS